MSSYPDAKLRRQRLYRRASKKTAKHHSSQFPFHQLPREIMIEIFMLCLPDFEHGTPSKKHAPLLLCSVCSSWRSLALDVPNLWNELCIRIAKPQSDEDNAAAMVETWISRSGALPLTLRLHVLPLFDCTKANVMVKAILNIYFRYAPRWECIDIDFIACFSIPFPEFGPTPFLRSFTYSTPSTIPTRFPFTSCPLLSTFTWPFSCSIASKSDIPWHQLTHITMEHILSTHQTLDILRSCPQLVKLRAEIDDDLNLDQASLCQHQVDNRTLRHFHLVVYRSCSALLQTISLPALTEFSLDTDFDSVGFISSRHVHKELLRFLTRSKCKLERLKLGDCGFSDGEMLRCLKHASCASLVELTVANVYNRPIFTDRVILALTDRDVLSEDTNILLPNLSHLSLEMCLCATPGVLGLMVLSRCLWWDEEDRMKTLTLIVRDLASWDHKFLKIARNSGLDVDISVEPYTDSEIIDDSFAVGF